MLEKERSEDLRRSRGSGRGEGEGSWWAVGRSGRRCLAAAEGGSVAVVLPVVAARVGGSGGLLESLIVGWKPGSQSAVRGGLERDIISDEKEREGEDFAASAVVGP